MDDTTDYSGDGGSTTSDTIDAIDQLAGSAAGLINAVRGNSTPPPPQQVTSPDASTGPVVQKTSVQISPVLLLVGLAVLVVLVRR